MLNLLKRYRTNKAELQCRQIDIEELQKRIEYYNKEYTETVEECIQGEALQAQQLSHVPRSETNKFNSKTENVAEHYNTVHSNHYDIDELKLKKNAMERLVQEIRKEVLITEALVNSLTDKERFVIELHYFNGYTLEEIITLFSNRFGYGSRDSIKQSRDKAINKMELIYKKSA